ncbi:MAG: hypothetical protein GXP46_06450 [Deferribacteres bacterium]|nr:hypothetical protein [Deferribacteres bacterium]
MFRRSLTVFVIPIFLFGVFALTEAYAFRGGASDGIKVYDANGQYLGLSSFSHLYSVYVPSMSTYVGIDLSTGEARIVDLYFKSNDCTGTPYVRPSQTYWIGKNRVKYYTGARTVPVKKKINSWDNGYSECVVHHIGFVSVVPAEEVPAASLPFTFPVALPLEFR